MGNELRRDTFEIDSMFTHGNIAYEIIFMDITKVAQEIARSGPRAFGSVDVNRSNAIAIIITRPFVFTMIDRDSLTFNMIIARPFIRIGDRVNVIFGLRAPNQLERLLFARANYPFETLLRDSICRNRHNCIIRFALIRHRNCVAPVFLEQQHLRQRGLGPRFFQKVHHTRF